MSLLKYCAEGDLTKIKATLKLSRRRQSKLQIRDNDNWTCLHHAVKSGSIDCIRYLLTIDELDTTAETFEGETALHIACTMPNVSIDIVSMLFDASPDLINFVNNKEVDLLQCAIMRDRLDIVKLLIANGAPVNKQDLDGDTSLHIAAIDSHLKVIRYLLYDTTCDATIRNRNGKTACMILYTKLIEKLVQNAEPSIDEIDCFEELLQFTYNSFDLNDPSDKEMDLKQMIYLGYVYEQPNSDLYPKILQSFHVPPTKQYFFQKILQTNVYSRHCLTIALLAHGDIAFEHLFEFWSKFLLELFTLFLADELFFQEYIAEIMSDGWICSLRSQVSSFGCYLSAFKFVPQRLFTFLKTMILYGIDFDILLRCCELFLTPELIVTVFAPLAKFVMPYYPICLRNFLGCDYNFNESWNPLHDIDRSKNRYATHEVVSLKNLCRMSIRLYHFQTYSHHTALKALHSLPIPERLRNFLCYNICNLKFCNENDPL